MQVRVLAAFKFSLEKTISATVNKQKINGRNNFFILRIIKLFLNIVKFIPLC